MAGGSNETTPPLFPEAGGRGGGPAADPWGIVRELDNLRRAVESVDKRMVTADRFDEAQRGIDRRFMEQDRRQAEWEVKSEGAHRELAATDRALAQDITNVRREADEKVDRVLEKMDERDKQARSWRNQVWLGIALAFVAVLAPSVLRALQIGTGAP